MIKIMRDKWDANREKLRDALSTLLNINDITYDDIVKMTFGIIYNGYEKTEHALDLEHITIVDNGDYQGTLLFIIPFGCYQPQENEYLMTYVSYGSCSCCDTLQGIQADGEYGQKPNDEQVKDLLTLCRDIICNTIRPYNYGWRYGEEFERVEMEE